MTIYQRTAVRPSLLRIFVIAALIVFTGANLPAATADNAVGTASLSVDEIVSRAVVKDDLLRASRTKLKCDRTVKTDRLDASGKVTETATVKTVELPTAALEYTTDVESAKGKAAGGSGEAKVEKINAVMSLRKLAPRYDMTLLGEEPVRGQPCFLVAYKPKANQPPAPTREEKVMSNLKGRFWISKSDFSILQSEGTLAGPVTLAVIASMNQMDIKYRSQTLANGDTCPLDVVVTMAVKAPFYDFRQKQVTTEENWRAR